jgi:hypothetical protein
MNARCQFTTAEPSQCTLAAKYMRDGLPACGLHLKAPNPQPWQHSKTPVVTSDREARREKRQEEMRQRSWVYDERVYNCGRRPRKQHDGPYIKLKPSVRMSLEGLSLEDIWEARLASLGLAPLDDKWGRSIRIGALTFYANMEVIENIRLNKRLGYPERSAWMDI